MAAFKRFEEIHAWQMGRELVALIYRLSHGSELKRDYGFRDQIQRAAVSICSNIAEGFGRRGNREFTHFLWIAKGSASEVASQAYHLKDLGYVDDDGFDEIFSRANSIAAAIHKLIEAISGSEPRTPNPEPRTPNPEPRTPNPEPRTPNPEPRTPNPVPRTSS